MLLFDYVILVPTNSVNMRSKKRLPPFNSHRCASTSITNVITTLQEKLHPVFESLHSLSRIFLVMDKHDVSCKFRLLMQFLSHPIIAKTLTKIIWRNLGNFVVIATSIVIILAQIECSYCPQIGHVMFNYPINLVVNILNPRVPRSSKPVTCATAATTNSTVTTVSIPTSKDLVLWFKIVVSMSSNSTCFISKKYDS